MQLKLIVFYKLLCKINWNFWQFFNKIQKVQVKWWCFHRYLHTNIYWKQDRALGRAKYLGKIKFLGGKWPPFSLHSAPVTKVKFSYGGVIAVNSPVTFGYFLAAYARITIIELNHKSWIINEKTDLRSNHESLFSKWFESQITNYNLNPQNLKITYKNQNK